MDLDDLLFNGDVGLLEPGPASLIYPGEGDSGSDLVLEGNTFAS